MAHSARPGGHDQAHRQIHSRASRPADDHKQSAVTGHALLKPAYTTPTPGHAGRAALLVAKRSPAMADARHPLVADANVRAEHPVRLSGLKVSARIGAREITITHGGREVARHERLHGKFHTSAQLDHYLELLARKPGALEHSVALAQERDRGSWPDCFDQLWAALTGRYGRSDAARQMVDVVLLCREHGPASVELAVRGAVTAGAIDGRAVALLARRIQSTASAPSGPLTDLEPRLAAHDRPAPGDLADYDQLHNREARR